MTDLQANFQAFSLRAMSERYDERRLIRDGQNTSVLREVVYMGRDLARALAADLEVLSREH